MSINAAIAIANTVIAMQYPFIGAFNCPPMTNCSLQMSPNLKEWYDVPDENVTMLSNGDWGINPKSEYVGAHGNINKGTMFYRVIQRP